MHAVLTVVSVPVEETVGMKIWVGPKTGGPLEAWAPLEVGLGPKAVNADDLPSPVTWQNIWQNIIRICFSQGRTKGSGREGSKGRWNLWRGHFWPDGSFSGVAWSIGVWVSAGTKMKVGLVRVWWIPGPPCAIRTGEGDVEGGLEFGDVALSRELWLEDRSATVNWEEAGEADSATTGSLDLSGMGMLLCGKWCCSLWYKMMSSAGGCHASWTIFRGWGSIWWDEFIHL